MRVPRIRRRALAAALLAPAVVSLAATKPAAADGPASPGPHATVGTAGTSFLTATAVEPGRPVELPASTGDYLYWSFAATAGQTDAVTVSLTLPPAASRHGAATWTVDVFDGLRRRQACTAGPQTVTAQAGDGEISLGCTMRQIRSWAEPWSDDPLPGTYYLRLSVIGLPEQDLGLPIRVRLELTARDGDAEPAGGRLKAPLSPPTGTAQAADASPSGDPSADPQAAGAAPQPPKPGRHWFSWPSWPSSRWWWTIGGGVLSALAGMAGLQLTRHPHRWFS